MAVSRSFSVTRRIWGTTRRVSLAALRAAVEARVLVILATLVMAGMLVWRGTSYRFEPPAWERGQPVPARVGARPCCSFGIGQRVKFGPIPIPGARAGRTAQIGELGAHRYDGRYGPVGESGSSFSRGEDDAFFYTCKSGFVDTAAVREGVDHTAYLTAEFMRVLGTDATIELADHGAKLAVHYKGMADAATLDSSERRAVAVRLAQWTAYQLSIWREIAQWYGRTTRSAFPEYADSFSPEDIVSAGIGIRLADDLDPGTHLRSETSYDDWVDEALAATLKAQHAVEPKLARRLAFALDQKWWNSRRYLPDKDVVRKRFTAISPDIDPWAIPRPFLAPDRGLAQDLELACRKHSRKRLCIPTLLGEDPCCRDDACGEKIEGLVTVEVKVPKRRCTTDDRSCVEDSIDATHFRIEVQRNKVGKRPRRLPFRAGREFDQTEFEQRVSEVLVLMRQDLADPDVDRPDVLLEAP